MSIINHIVKGGFVFATSVAAFTHSVWVLGTLMSGVQPLPPNDLATTLGAVFLVKTVAWHFAPVLIATAIDIGFVQTSRRIESARGVGRKVSVTLYVTFGVLALTMYFLQFVYMAVHVPHIDLGAGVSEQLKLSLKGLFDASVFVIPALLPIAIALYTFASDGHDETPVNAPQTPLNNAPAVVIPDPAPTVIVTAIAPAQLPAAMTPTDVGLPDPALQPDRVETPVKRRARKPIVDMSAAPPPAPGLFD